MYSPAAIPFWQPRVYELGPIPIDPWATLVCLAFILGLEVCRARGIRRGLEPRDVVDGAVVIVGMGFVVGHLVHVLGYHPEQYEKDGIVSLLRVWAGFSSMGGMLGAVIGYVLFFGFIRNSAPLSTVFGGSFSEVWGRIGKRFDRKFWTQGDNIMFGFPFAWFLGRMGCFSVHDHIGRETTFFLGVEFPANWLAAGDPGGIRHDLGLYEALWALCIAGVFLILDRKARKPGFFLATWCFLYAPIRFAMDFWRSTDLGVNRSDIRYWGLTPAQYLAVLMFLAGIGLLMMLRGSPVPEEGTSERAEEE
ncbi:MAG: prolipoprotein diacylglyceryl transferase family protein [Myxococcota bacterium]|nr:prolipoprotein diacylglyceryl transferase family protein [Myxococcota bacterium]